MRLWESSAPAEKETGKGLPSQSLALARFAGRYPSRPSIAAHRAVLSRMEGMQHPLFRGVDLFCDGGEGVHRGDAVSGEIGPVGGGGVRDLLRLPTQQLRRLCRPEIGAVIGGVPLHGGEQRPVGDLHPAALHRHLVRHAVQPGLDHREVRVFRNSGHAELPPGLSGHHAVGPSAGDGRHIVVDALLIVVEAV